MLTRQDAPDWIIRDATEADITAVLKLWAESEARPSLTDNEQVVADLLKANPGALFVADVKGKVVGAVIATFDGWRGNIYRLAVNADYRRRGLARAMVAESEDRLRRMGAKRMTALVESDHPYATGFWDDAGYERDPVMLRYFKNLPG
jgi:ribosomal protein S18 acetylase RimI-like enzyme